MWDESQKWVGGIVIRRFAKNKKGNTKHVQSWWVEFRKTIYMLWWHAFQVWFWLFLNKKCYFFSWIRQSHSKLRETNVWSDLTIPTIRHWFHRSCSLYWNHNVISQSYEKGALAKVSDNGFCRSNKTNHSTLYSKHPPPIYTVSFISRRTRR